MIRRTVSVLVVAAILGAGGYAAYAWSQKQYFVATTDGHVAIFRGVSQNLGPLTLSHIESQSDVLVSDLPTDIQGAVGSSIPARDLADAQGKVDKLRTEAQRCQQLAATGIPCGTSPTPAQSSVPTVPPTTQPTLPTLPSPSATAPRPLTTFMTPPPVALHGTMRPAGVVV